MYKIIRFLSFLFLGLIFSTVLIFNVFRYVDLFTDFTIYTSIKDIMIHYVYWIVIVIQCTIIYAYAGIKDTIKPTLLAIERISKAEDSYKNKLK